MHVWHLLYGILPFATSSILRKIWGHQRMKSSEKGGWFPTEKKLLKRAEWWRRGRRVNREIKCFLSGVPAASFAFV